MKRIAAYIMCLFLAMAVLPVAAAALGEAEILVEEFPAEEEAAMEEALPTTYTLPSGETIEVDPEDPLYEIMMSSTMVLDGAWSDMASFKNYTPRSVEGETVVPGIDVSAWQGTIKWDQVAASGVEFVILRGAYRGTSTGALGRDSQFYTYIKGAKEAGLKVGVYIYSQAITVEEGIEEANYLLNLVKGYEIDLPLVIDYEYFNTSGRLYNAKLSRREATDICLAFCETVEAAGYDSMVYANASMLSDNLYCSELERVWLAHYTKKTDYSGEYEYWQCSQYGSVSGIAGNVDMDFWFRVEEEELPTATPVPTPEESGPFADVTEDMWFYDTVMSAYEQGVVNGVSAAEFRPADTASRGQVVTMLWRLMGKPAVTEEASFGDLTEDYYRDAVNWAASKGVVNGFSATEFCPDEQICRQDLVTILYRLEGEPSVSGNLNAYTDGGAVQSYAEKAMLWAVSKGIITGYEDATLGPDNSASRAEVCAILMRYMDL